MVTGKVRFWLLYAAWNLSLFGILCLVPVPGGLMVKLANFLQINRRLRDLQ